MCLLHLTKMYNTAPQNLQYCSSCYFGMTCTNGASNQLSFWPPSCISRSVVSIEYRSSLTKPNTQRLCTVSILVSRLCWGISQQIHHNHLTNWKLTAVRQVLCQAVPQQQLSVILEGLPTHHYLDLKDTYIDHLYFSNRKRRILLVENNQMQWGLVVWDTLLISVSYMERPNKQYEHAS